MTDVSNCARGGSQGESWCTSGKKERFDHCLSPVPRNRQQYARFCTACQAKPRIVSVRSTASRSDQAHKSLVMPLPPLWPLWRVALDLERATNPGDGALRQGIAQEIDLPCRTILGRRCGLGLVRRRVWVRRKVRGDECRAAPHRLPSSLRRHPRPLARRAEPASSGTGVPTRGRAAGLICRSRIGRARGGQF